MNVSELVKLQVELEKKRKRLLQQYLKAQNEEDEILALMQAKIG